jgi:hypothetical protein
VFITISPAHTVLLFAACNMIGDVPVTSGDAYLAGASIVSNIYEAYSVLGFCPQVRLAFHCTVRYH